MKKLIKIYLIVCFNVLIMKMEFDIYYKIKIIKKNLLKICLLKDT